MNNAFVIVRVSAEDQLKGYGPEVQWEDDVLPAAAVLDLIVSEANRRIIQESATGWERIRFEAAVREALSMYHRGEINTLLFPRVDRETRFIFGSITLLAEVVKTGLQVCFARERLTLDPADPESVERYLTKATQAQAYVQTMKTNTSRAKQRLLREGKLPQGTGIGLYGFKWDTKLKKRIPIDYEVKVVQKVFALMDNGVGFFNVAKALNEQGILTKSGSRWHPFTVKRLATNPAYIGLTYFGKTSRSSGGKLVAKDEKEWRLLPDTTPAIIGKELFHRVQDKIKRSKELHSAMPHREYLLTGHIVCADCGSPVVGACLSRKHRYYRCRSTSPTAVSGKTCNSRYIRADYIEDQVWKNVRDVLEHPEVILAEIKRQLDEQGIGESDPTREIDGLEKSLRDYDKQEKRLVSLLRHGTVTEDYVLDELNKLKAERKRGQEDLQKLSETKAKLDRLADAEISLNELCLRVKRNLDNPTLQEKRLALDALDIRVTASTQGIHIKGILPIEYQLATASADVTTIAQTSA